MSLEPDPRHGFMPDIRAEHKEKERQKRNELLERYEHKRKQWFQKFVSMRARSTNTSKEVYAKHERAAFVLGRPLTQWTEENGALGDRFLEPREIIDALKIFFHDGGILHYKDLLLTDPNRSDNASAAMTHKHYEIDAANYDIPLGRYKTYVRERTMEPVFLLMSRIKSEQLYNKYIDHPHTVVAHSDLNNFTPGTTIWTAPRRPATASEPTPTDEGETSSEEETLPPVEVSRKPTQQRSAFSTFFGTSRDTAEQDDDN